MEEARKEERENLPNITHVPATKPLSKEMSDMIFKMAMEAGDDLYDDIIKDYLGKMSELSRASAEYFVKTGTVNGSFLLALRRMLKFHDDICHEAYSNESKWVDVNERLPEFGVPVLIYNLKGGILRGYIDKRHKWWMHFKEGERMGEYYIHSVTHWQPLPQIPSPKNEKI